ncbi:MAG: DegV family protein [Oscillospiraceae bacterium]|nr:DegV family protein [Oscillospiraceae bacterium]
MGEFILSCESTIDTSYEYVRQRDLPVLFYSYIVDERVYTDDLGRDEQSIPNFYKLLESGKMPRTTALNIEQYREFFEEQSAKGDLLHIAFGSGMSSSVNNAMIAADMVREEHPERRIVVIDSLCSSSGYGLLVDGAADLRDAGRSFDETEAWVRENLGRIHHQFFSTTLEYFRRGGRVSGPMAAIGTVLNICPIMHLDHTGSIIAYGKVRGKKAAMRTTVETMEREASGGRDYAGPCWISTSHCPEDAAVLAEMVCERFPNLRGKIKIWEIGVVIAAHTGPGTVAVFYMGDERQPD